MRHWKTAQMTRSLKRKLAVILHADVVDSTRMVQTDDVRAHEAFQLKFIELESFIKHHDGITHERRGDALVAEFSRASDAVAAALNFQQAATAQHDIDITESDNSSSAVGLRIGISLGEVIIADGTITGAGVVMAQRLEQIAESGGVVVQAAVAETVPNYLPYVFDDLGELELKGFDETIRAKTARVQPIDEVSDNQDNNAKQKESKGVIARALHRRQLSLVVGCCVLFAISVIAYVLFARSNPDVPASRSERQSNLSAAPDMLSTETTTEQQQSIAVLPFNNLSSSSDDDYLSDGMTEDLITDLSSLSGLLVIARNSVFIYKGKTVSNDTVATELGVRYVLSGSLRRAGDKLRINVELTDTQNNAQVWAARYDRQTSDIFELQDEISQTIVDALAIELTPPEKKQLAKRPTDNLEAYDYYQRGRSYIFTNQNELGQALLRKAIDLDPQFAEAYSALSYSLAITVSFGTADHMDDELDTAFRLATKAVSMDNHSPSAFYSLAYTFLLRGQHNESIKAAERAIAILPNYASAHGIHGWTLTLSGDYLKALDSLSRAVKLQPTANGVILGVQGSTYYMVDRFDEAAALLEASNEQSPALVTTRAFLAATYQQLGRPDDAAWEVEELLAINPDFNIRQWRWIEVFKNQQDPRFLRLIKDLENAGLPLH